MPEAVIACVTIFCKESLPVTSWMFVPSAKSNFMFLSVVEKGNIVDGTKGNWTLQEGNNDIFIINNKSGEKFKIKLDKIGDS